MRSKMHATLALWALTLAVGAAPLAAQPPGSVPDPVSQDEIDLLAEVQARHEKDLMAMPGVIAVGIARGESGGLALLVLVDRDRERPSLPERLEGFEVMARPSGQFYLGHGVPNCVAPCHADQQTLPVEMGNSGRNTASCSSCTLGFKACDPESRRFVYVTNAHCTTLPDKTLAQVGTVTRHLARGDVPGCGFRSIIGTVGGNAHPCDAGNDTVDASKIFSDYSLTTSAVRDIGWPLASPGTPALGILVRKSGQSSGLTQGVITAINVTVDVPDDQYFCDDVVLQDQLYITPLDVVWSQPGDSGSGVFNSAGQPVGLNWATEDDGVTGIANTIGNVLSALGLSLNLFGCSEDCALTRAAEGVARGVELLEMAHRLNDEILPRSPRGKRYRRLYEEVSPELVSQMAAKPRLLERTRRLLVRHRGTLAAIVVGGVGRVNRHDLRELDQLLADFSEGGSPRLREALDTLRRDIRDPKVQADFGIEVEGTS